MNVEAAGKDHMLSILVDLCSLGRDVLNSFAAPFKVSVLDRGEDFVRAGEIGGDVCFVHEGLLRSYYLSPKGEEFNKHFFLEGSFAAPLASLVTREPSPVNIAALERTTVLKARYSHLLQTYDTSPILNKVGRVLVEYAWIGKERRETQLIMLDATERYRAFLKEFPGLSQRIPQYQFASYLGITPVQLSRIRSQRSKKAEKSARS